MSVSKIPKEPAVEEITLPGLITSNAGMIVTDLNWSNRIIGGYAQTTNGTYYISIRASASGKVVVCVHDETQPLASTINVKVILYKV